MMKGRKRWAKVECYEDGEWISAKEANRRVKVEMREDLRYRQLMRQTKRQLWDAFFGPGDVSGPYTFGDTDKHFLTLCLMSQEAYAREFAEVQP